MKLKIMYIPVVLAVLGLALGGYLSPGKKSVKEVTYMMEVETKLPTDSRIFKQYFSMQTGTGIWGKELEGNFYCTYWLNEKTTKYPNFEVTGAGVDCQPCQRYDYCSSEQSMEVKDFTGESTLELATQGNWVHKIRFIKVLL